MILLLTCLVLPVCVPLQACIDDNSDMVEFLVDGYADVDICDNEGWTPLHATASCGFAEIARWCSLSFLLIVSIF